MPEANKATVTRFVNEILNHGRLDIIVEGDKVVGRFTCTGTHLGTWLGHPPTGRRLRQLALT